MGDVIILFFICLVITLTGFISALYLRKMVSVIKDKFREKHMHKQNKKISRMKARVVKEPKKISRMKARVVKEFKKRLRKG